MWNYRQLSRRESPMAEILSRCSSKANINLVIYHLSENHVECATVPDVDKFRLGETARTIKADSKHNHAILAYDLGTNEVYKIEDVPELPVASAVLLCVVTELMNGAVLPRENQYGTPVARRTAAPTNNVARGANGRFVRQEPQFEETYEEPAPRPTRVVDEGAPVIRGHRFRLGKH